VAHSITVIAFNLLARRTAYSDLGWNYFDERQRDSVRYRLTARLEALGFTVQLQPLT
jgi:transposase